MLPVFGQMRARKRVWWVSWTNEWVNVVRASCYQANSCNEHFPHENRAHFHDGKLLCYAKWYNIKIMLPEWHIINYKLNFMLFCIRESKKCECAFIVSSINHIRIYSYSFRNECPFILWMRFYPILWKFQWVAIEMCRKKTAKNLN